MQIRDLLNIVDGQRQVISELKYGEEDPNNPGFMWIKDPKATSSFGTKDGNMIANGTGGYWNAIKVPIQGTDTNTNTPANVPPAVPPAPEAPPAEVNTEPDAQNLPPPPAQDTNDYMDVPHSSPVTCTPEVQAEIMKQKSFKAAFALARKSGCSEFNWCQIVDVPGTAPKPSEPERPATHIAPWVVGPGASMPGTTQQQQDFLDAVAMGNMGSESIEHQGTVLEDELGAVLRLGSVVHEAAGIPEIKAPTKQTAIAIAQKKGIKRFRYCGRYGTKLGKGGTAPMPTPRPKPQPQPKPQPAAPTTQEFPNVNAMGDFTGYYDTVEVPAKK